MKVYGGDASISALRAELLSLLMMSRSTLETCLLSYIAYGWIGMVPATCHKSIIFAPINVAPRLWRWPCRFLDGMAGAKSTIFAVGLYIGQVFSTGRRDR